MKLRIIALRAKVRCNPSTVFGHIRALETRATSLLIYPRLQIFEQKVDCSQSKYRLENESAAFSFYGALREFIWHDSLSSPSPSTVSKKIQPINELVRVSCTRAHSVERFENFLCEEEENNYARILNLFWLLKWLLYKLNCYKGVKNPNLPLSYFYLVNSSSENFEKCGCAYRLIWDQVHLLRKKNEVIQQQAKR